MQSRWRAAPALTSAWSSPRGRSGARKARWAMMAAAISVRMALDSCATASCSRVRLREEAALRRAATSGKEAARAQSRTAAGATGRGPGLAREGRAGGAASGGALPPVAGWGSGEGLLGLALR